MNRNGKFRIVSNVSRQARARGAVIGQPASTIGRTSAGNAGTPTAQSPGAGAAGAGAPGGAGVGTPLAQGAPTAPSPARRAGPAVVPAPSAQPLAASQVPPTSQPNLMQKFTEMTAPGGDILSKGKELIFMKFGLGGKWFRAGGLGRFRPVTATVTPKTPDIITWNSYPHRRSASMVWMDNLLLLKWFCWILFWNSADFSVEIFYFKPFCLSIMGYCPWEEL